MTRITRILAVPAVGAYYYEDLTALQSNPIPLAERYTAAPVTPGFRAVREEAEAVSVGLVLDTGQVAWGDCVAVAYSGKAGRDPVFRAQDGLATIQRVVAPLLQDREITAFRELAGEVDDLIESVEVIKPLPQPPGMTRRDLLTAPARLWRAAREEEAPHPTPVERVTVERKLHTAVRYGVSQALLRAVALTRGVTMAEVITEEWDLPLPDAPVPIHAQSGSERYHNADKMIVRRVASLPHALVDDIPEQLGADSVELIRYVRWLRKRIRELGGPRDSYRPTIHLDMHGALGQIFENDPSTGSGPSLGRVLGQIYALEAAARPYPLRIECPVMMESRKAQIEAMKTLREYVSFRKMKVQLVVDEWANTLDDIRAFVDAQAAGVIQIKMPDLGSVHNSVEAVLACQAGGVGAFLGGSCCETDLSAKVAVHVALATQPDIIMAKPGMGVDEGIMLVQNEMARTLAWIRARG
ncbi:MAG: methylaspartate ammonia-lyase [Chloroflexota bacterium]|nr:methylaspartate ammonia-lyase [Chloroflexota bacterium]